MPLPILSPGCAVWTLGPEMMRPFQAHRLSSTEVFEGLDSGAGFQAEVAGLESALIRNLAKTSSIRGPSHHNLAAHRMLLYQGTFLTKRFVINHASASSRYVTVCLTVRLRIDAPPQGSSPSALRMQLQNKVSMIR